MPKTTNSNFNAALEEASWEHNVFKGVRLERATMTVSDGNIVAPTPLSFNLDDYVGFTFRGKPILDLEGVKAQIDSGNTLCAPSGTIP